jgi:sec-independent protein translocase protein TatB
VFNISPEKLLLLLILALVVLGPQRLPDAARTVGKAIARFRQLSNALQDDVRGALHEPIKALSNPVSAAPDDPSSN